MSWQSVALIALVVYLVGIPPATRLLYDVDPHDNVLWALSWPLLLVVGALATAYDRGMDVLAAYRRRRASR